ISRSIWTEQGFHGFVDCQHLKQYECSRYLVDKVGKIVDALIDNDIPLATFKHQPSDLKKLSENVVSLLANKYDISNINR
ncbi:hypothetical protein ACSL0S_22895, partial [Salmonella enterica]